MLYKGRYPTRIRVISSDSALNKRVTVILNNGHKYVVAGLKPCLDVPQIGWGIELYSQAHGYESKLLGYGDFESWPKIRR
jgi:hypothetical protein